MNYSTNSTLLCFHVDCSPGFPLKLSWFSKFNWWVKYFAWMWASQITLALKCCCLLYMGINFCLIKKCYAVWQTIFVILDWRCYFHCKYAAEGLAFGNSVYWVRFDEEFSEKVISLSWFCNFIISLKCFCEFYL